MMLKRSIVFAGMVLCVVLTNAQPIPVNEVERIETFLSSDELMGRAVHTPGIDKAADFIAEEFRKAGLEPVSGDSYFQEFTMNRNRFISAKGTVNGVEIRPGNIVAFSSSEKITLTEKDGYEYVSVGAKDTLYPKIQRMIGAPKNYILFVDSAHMRMFHTLKRFRRESMPFGNNVIVLLSTMQPTTYSIEFNQEVTPLKMKNVVGLLPGKKKRKEMVIFSAHYDHVGIDSPTPEGDSIYNGANDDASGTAAVILLANHFSKLKDNDRTLVFAAFTAEETGGHGSKYFSTQFKPEQVMAMFNIEMIGTESKWGKNSAYITGYDKSDMGKIMGENLKGSSFEFHPDPYPAQNLFYRSDNATLARLGVPAHTISTSKMDSEKYYHTADDEIHTLDLENMAKIIEAIALSSRTIVAGKDTPSRVSL